MLLVAAVCSSTTSERRLVDLGKLFVNALDQVSIPFWTETWQPDSFYDKICENLSRGLHTLCLLDIKV